MNDVKEKDHLNKAKEVADNEFFTFYDDIKKELINYKTYFKNQIVYCNCDNPFTSNFVKFFIKNFNEYKLKKLIVTNYAFLKFNGKQLFLKDVIKKPPQQNSNQDKIAYKVVIDDVNKLNYVDDDLNNMKTFFNKNKNIIKELEGDGDFESLECIKILKGADIIVTNPPFSEMKNYIHQLFKYKKKFLIVSDLNKLSAMYIFKPLLNKRIWIGYNDIFIFFNLNNQEKNISGLWLTNLPVDITRKKIIMKEKNNKNNYLKYLNYDAIDVNRIDKIPADYYGEMGVPISILKNDFDEYFNIINIDSCLKKTSYKIQDLNNKIIDIGTSDRFYVYCNNINEKKNIKYVDIKNNKTIKRCYVKIVIQRKK